MKEKLVAVLTTIQAPTPSVRKLASRLVAIGAETLVVGDKKGPFEYAVPGTRLLTLDAQLRSPFALARALPVGHYARKNVGYLQAIADGATCVYETDDDNHPDATWAPRSRRTAAAPLQSPGWVNAYACFSRDGDVIWPRGLPLDAVRTGSVPMPGPARTMDAPIQQGLADGSPDVDAVWRLVLDRDVRFERRPSVVLQPGTWCPFNSQTTWWWEPAFPLLYLPSHCSFRMTDIWRSFVAQRCLWAALDVGIVFHAPEVEQVRNEHDLMRDFEQEIPGYRGNRRIAQLLERLPLEPGPERVGANLLRCYEALVTEGYVLPQELDLVGRWNADLASIGAGTVRGAGDGLR
jgi:hypothetical protein